MKSGETFKRIMNLRNNKFSLRVLMTGMVSIEILVCVILVYSLSTILNNIIHIKIPILLELIVLSLFIGFLVTGFILKWFFEPIKKLRKSMEKVADGDFTVRLETKSSSK